MKDQSELHSQRGKPWCGCSHKGINVGPQCTDEGEQRMEGEKREEQVMEGEEKGEGGMEGIVAMEACYQGFNPAVYLQYNYTAPRADFHRPDSIVPWKLNCLHKAFTERGIKGEVVVDVGSGPTLYQVMSACEHFDRVILSDFLEVNRKELRTWLQGGETSLDWTPYLQHVCELEGRSPAVWRDKAERLRSVVTDVLPIDVHQPHPLPPGTLPSSGADCLVSTFCLESVSPDLASFTRALGHLFGLLRRGGHLLLIGALGESFYMGGPGLQIPVVSLEEAQVCSSLRTCGYDLLRLSVYHLPPDMRIGVDDVTGVFFAEARKP
ncbi:phenylethanolamine N-methyltransferase [Brachyhypopomus gauderio]|uniref:phenylethanolamine N-methyltransferase n=1 Tax=Brachyhypopomus gauderio TaxID=698409 RepID=UPI004041F409